MSEGRLVLVPGDLRESETQLIFAASLHKSGELMSFAVNYTVPFATVRSEFLLMIPAKLLL